MKRIIFFAAWLFLPGFFSCFADNSVEQLGRYSNEISSVSDDPHIEGYSLSLYRQNAIVFGRFCWATGIEVFCAPVRDIKLDPSSHKLSFQAKLSTGTEISKETGLEGRPARDLGTH